MSPRAAHKNQTLFDYKISLFDIIMCFKKFKKTFTIFLLIGGFCGGLYAKLNLPIYVGSAILIPGRLFNEYIEKPGDLVAKLNNGSYPTYSYSKETLEACMGSLDKTENSHDDLKKIVLINPIKNSDLFLLSMKSSEKKTIHECFNHIKTDINLNEKELIVPVIEATKTYIKEIKSRQEKDVFYFDINSQSRIGAKLYVYEREILMQPINTHLTTLGPIHFKQPPFNTPIAKIILGAILSFFFSTLFILFTARNIIKR